MSSFKVPRCDRSEYMLLMKRMLSCGKMVLCSDPKGVGSLFLVPKSTPGRCRPVWHGGVISEACERPPHPRRLGNPASFLDLIFRKDEQWFLAKRDAASYFDVLQAPAGAQRWFCCPPLAAKDFASCLGCTVDDLCRHAISDNQASWTENTLLFPASTTWPMGFSWSSAVAQDVTLETLLTTGFPENAVLCDSHETLEDEGAYAVICTDDTIFINRDLGEQQQTVSAFDSELERAGIPRAIDKDIDGADALTALGCHLTTTPPLASPDASKLRKLLCGILGAVDARQASPKGLHGLLGLASWFCILSRPHYACFSTVYEFVRREPETTLTALPRVAIDELCIFLALAPLLTAGLDRDWMPLLTATDASPAFGFGASVCKLPIDDIARIGRKAEKRGDFVRLTRETGDTEPEKSRLGTPHYLGISKNDFTDVLCVKARVAEHAGIMELKGILMLLKWILRSKTHFHRRIVMLIDAKAPLSAVAKGRTGSPAFFRTLCSINAHLLASDSLLRPVYIPSEDNPADGPSRGKRRRPPGRRVLKKKGFCKGERALHSRQRELNALASSLERVIELERSWGAL